MSKIEIKDLGPVNKCVMDIDHFMVLTGAQASGKSTIAKAVFFCKSIKDDIYDIITKRVLLGANNTLFHDVIKVLRSKFLQLFGTSMAMKPTMKLVYQYDDKTFIRISLKLQEGYDYLLPRYVWIDFSENINDFFRKTVPVQSIQSGELKLQLNDLFKDDCETIFIPAGRSLISLFTSQLNYLFTTMDDEQKRSIDFCTQKYIEKILRIRPLFENGIDGLISQKRNTPGAKIDFKAIDKLLELMKDVLKGRYVFKDNEERLYIDEKHFVKINYTSSGQQETVWIFNILLHLLINNTKAFIILEEPEAHLYPEAQKKVVEILAFIAGKSSNVLMTTHSPYILGAINNLIYAEKLGENPDLHRMVNEQVEEEFHIKNHSAYFLEDGKMESCVEEESEGGLIVNEVIDGASSDINNLYDRLFDIEYGQESCV